MQIFWQKYKVGIEWYENIKKEKFSTLIHKTDTLSLIPRESLKSGEGWDIDSLHGPTQIQQTLKTAIRQWNR